MKVKNKNTQKYGLAALAVAIILIGVGLVWLNRSHDMTPTTSTNNPTSEQKQSEATTNAAGKQSLINGTSPAGDPNNNPTPPPQAASVELSAKQESNGSITVFAKLYNVSNGTCNLTVKNGAKQNSQSASVIYQAEYSSCAGFSIPTSALGSGNWDINLSVISNGQNFSNNISYQVK